ncbi:MAG: hypothetical protein WC548_04005 [Candidatus Pacearchaeota archaeon]
MKKEKKLKLKASQKDSRRYFLILKNERVEKIILDYLGIFGAAKASYVEVSGKNFSGKTVGSVLRESLDDVRAALALNGISVEKVSGTIKGLSK